MMDAVMKRCGCNTCDTFFMDGRDEFQHTHRNRCGRLSSVSVNNSVMKQKTNTGESVWTSINATLLAKRTANYQQFIISLPCSAHRIKDQNSSIQQREDKTRNLKNSIRFHSFKFLVNYKMHTQKRWTRKKEAMRGRSEAGWKERKEEPFAEIDKTHKQYFGWKWKRKPKRIAYSTNCFCSESWMLIWCAFEEENQTTVDPLAVAWQRTRFACVRALCNACLRVCVSECVISTKTNSFIRISIFRSSFWRCIRSFAMRQSRRSAAMKPVCLRFTFNRTIQRCLNN